MQLERTVEARPLLEEATGFDLAPEVRSNLHCHRPLLSRNVAVSLGKEQFEKANALGVSEEWQPAFHYCYGYTLYGLKEFQRAKRELILCLQSDPFGPELALRSAMLAATSRKLGEPSEARAYEEKAKLLKQ
jgi:hypothetical protein